MEIKTKVNKWDLIKLKSFCRSKGNCKQGGKTTLRMGENNSNETTDKGLISKIYKQLIQHQKNKQPNQKLGKRPKQTFHQRRDTDG